MHKVKEGLTRLRHKPALILFGAGDPIVKMGFHEKLAGFLPASRIVLVAGQDHFPHDGAATEIARIVAEWHASEVRRAA
jgi:pimeloyl-ACP methyl ester carboxylesterase